MTQVNEKVLRDLQTLVKTLTKEPKVLKTPTNVRKSIDKYRKDPNNKYRESILKKKYYQAKKLCSEFTGYITIFTD